jgi:hypothetical protein
MRLYYAQHPEHRPPPEILEKLREWPRPLSVSTWRVEQVRQGNPDPLIAHITGGGTLGAPERELFVELLMAKRGKRRHGLLQVEQFLTANAVEQFMKDDGKGTEAAVRKVMRLRGHSRRTVYEYIKAHKRRRGLISV